MSSKPYDVYIDSGITVRIPTGTDPDTPEGYNVLKDLATKKFVEILVRNQVDFTYEYLDAKDDK